MKQRLVGAAILVALVVVFLPMMVKEYAPDSDVAKFSFNVPTAPWVKAPVVTLALDDAGAPGAEMIADSGQESSQESSQESGQEGAQESAEAAPGKPAPPAAAEVKVAPAQAAGAYVVHFAAFATQEDADFTAQQLKAHGLPAFTETITLGGRPAVRVRVGPYQSQAEAEIARVEAAQVRADVQPRVFMLLDRAAADRTAAALERASGSHQAAAAAVGYAVQLGAFSNPASALALQERLHKAGIVAFTDTVNTARGTLTRVNAGPVSSHADANRLKARVKSALGEEGVVRAHP